MQGQYRILGIPNYGALAISTPALEAHPQFLEIYLSRQTAVGVRMTAAGGSGHPVIARLGDRSGSGPANCVQNLNGSNQR